MIQIDQIRRVIEDVKIPEMGRSLDIDKLGEFVAKAPLNCCKVVPSGCKSCGHDCGC